MELLTLFLAVLAAFLAAFLAAAIPFFVYEYFFPATFGIWFSYHLDLFAPKNPPPEGRVREIKLLASQGVLGAAALLWGVLSA